MLLLDLWALLARAGSLVPLPTAGKVTAHFFKRTVHQHMYSRLAICVRGTALWLSLMPFHQVRIALVHLDTVLITDAARPVWVRT